MFMQDVEDKEPVFAEELSQKERITDDNRENRERLEKFEISEPF